MSFSKYLLQRLIYAFLVLIVISFLIFMIVQLPRGDAVDRIVNARQAQGDIITEEDEAALRAQYGLDKPVFVQYFNWAAQFARGNMGHSMLGIPVDKLINERIAATVLLSVISLVVTYALAVPIGIYSATHQYSLGDYFWTFVGFIGLATPNFLLALILLFLFHKFFGLSIGGLFSPGVEEQPWSPAKALDLLNHLWIPIIVIVTAQTAGTIRTMRATLLDELGQQYVVTARAKGLRYRQLLFKYPVRLALNPVVNSIGYILPRLISGQTIVAIVLNLPTLGPLLFSALLAEDLELATSILMIQSILAVIGVILGDIILSAYDPRIRMEKGVT
ncbi:MAG: ABC transporter permease [Chloroflexi bacterium]|nr:ABC transporter permease [Chloroflexota bacterium]